MDDRQKRDLREAKNIREKYICENKKTEDKMTQLRKLDADAVKPGKIIALTVGIIGTLVLGLGMSCTMIWADKLFSVGILVGIIGLAAIAAAYPVFSHITKKQREKVAVRVLQLADEIIEDCNERIM